MSLTVDIEENSIDSALFLSLSNNWGDVILAMKPGAHLLLLNSIKDHHVGTVAAEDAGLEIRDILAYVFSDGENTPDLTLVTVARKPLQGTVADNVLKWGTGGLNIDKCRVGTESRPVMVRTNTVVENSCTENPTTGATSSGEVTSLGRWPANLLHCGSLTVQSMFPNTKGAKAGGFSNTPARSWKNASTAGINRVGYDDDGNAARFFYSAPCLNDLLGYLIKLVTPLSGTILTDCDTTTLPSNYIYVNKC